MLITCFPALMSPMLLYSPAQSPWASLAAPLKVTVRQQGGEVEGRVQIKLGSSSKFSLSQFWNNQPVVGGRKGLTPTLAFRAKSPSCSTSHSSLDLLKDRRYIFSFPPIHHNVISLWHFSWVSLLVDRAAISLLPNEKLKSPQTVALMISSGSST